MAAPRHTRQGAHSSSTLFVMIRNPPENTGRGKTWDGQGVGRGRRGAGRRAAWRGTASPALCWQQQLQQLGSLALAALSGLSRAPPDAAAGEHSPACAPLSLCLLSGLPACVLIVRGPAPASATVCAHNVLKASCLATAHADRHHLINRFTHGFRARCCSLCVPLHLGAADGRLCAPGGGAGH